MGKVIVTDIETFKNYFCVVNYDTNEKKYVIFEICSEVNDHDKMKRYYGSLSKKDYMVTFNGIDFDYPVLHWILKQKIVTARIIYQFVQKMIHSEEKWRFRIKYPKIGMLDLYKIWHFDNDARRTSLKYLEFTTRWHRLKDIPYHHSQELERDEQKEVALYCVNDVDATNHFLQFSKDKINLRFKMSKKYGIDFTNMPDSTIGSELMLHLYCKKTGLNKNTVRKSGGTEHDAIVISEILFDYLKFENDIFKKAYEFFEKQVIHAESKIEFVTNIDGIDYVYGLGGLHASAEGSFLTTDTHKIIDCDVASMYPSIAIVNKLYPSHLDPLFPEIYDKDIVGIRLKEKNKPKNQRDDVIIDGFKLAANSIYGKSNDKYSWMKDYSYTLSTTINGQLSLSMLIEQLLKIEGLSVIQINTDGVTVNCPIEKEKQYYNVCKKWEEKVNLTLEYVNYRAMHIRDVNNYIAVYADGSIKTKGCFEIDPDFHKNSSQRIVPIAMANYYVNGISVRKTIENHLSNEDYTIGPSTIKNYGIFDFCIGRKASTSTYVFTEEGKENIELNDKVIRFYVAKNKGRLYKRYVKGKRVGGIEKVVSGWNSQLYMDHIEQENYNVNFEYYINEATKIIKNIKSNKISKNINQLSLF